MSSSAALSPLGVDTGSPGHFSPEQRPHVLLGCACQPVSRVLSSECLLCPGVPGGGPWDLPPTPQGSWGFGICLEMPQAEVPV